MIRYIAIPIFYGVKVLGVCIYPAFLFKGDNYTHDHEVGIIATLTDIIR